MNTNTPLFRFALTIVTIWIAAFAYIAYCGYREEYRSTRYSIYNVPEDDVYECDSVIDATKGGLEFRDTTFEERSECYDRVILRHLRVVESGNRFAFEQAWKAFAWKGVLPALLLLGIVAFWTFISTGVGQVGSGYFNWLRYGTIKPNNANTVDKP